MKKVIVPLLFLSIYFGMYLRQASKKSKFSYEFGVSIPKGYESLGIDISHHQGKINWSELARVFDDHTLSFVYIKATEGITHTDSKWLINSAACREYKIKFGAYHFYQPNKNPIEQAKHFLNTYQFQHGDLPPVLDVEVESHSSIIPGVKEWLSYVEKETGVKPVVYTSLDFYQRLFQDEMKNHKFWIASYSRDPGLREDERMLHWQFTEKAKVQGITGLVDMNVSKTRFKIRE
jgi:lysozyme